MSRIFLVLGSAKSILEFVHYITSGLPILPAIWHNCGHEGLRSATNAGGRGRSPFPPDRALHLFSRLDVGTLDLLSKDFERPKRLPGKNPPLSGGRRLERGLGPMPAAKRSGSRGPPRRP